MESVQSVLRNYGDRMEVLQGTLGRLHGALRQMAQSSSGRSGTENNAQGLGDPTAVDIDIELPPLEVAQLHVASAFATCTLIFVFWLICENGIYREIADPWQARVQQYMHKISRQTSVSGIQRPKVDTSAAKRFVHFHTSRQPQVFEAPSVKDPKSTATKSVDTRVQPNEENAMCSDHPHGSRKQKQKKKPKKKAVNTPKGDKVDHQF